VAKKSRAFSNLKGVVPDYKEVTASDRQLRVNAETDKRAAKSMMELADEYGELCLSDDAAAAEAKERNIKFEALERRILPILENAKAQGYGDMWRGLGQTFSPKYKPRPAVKDRSALLKWIKDTGQEDQLTLPDGRLGEIIKEAFDEQIAMALHPDDRAKLKPGQPGSMQAPPGVEVYLQTTVHHTGGKQQEPTDDD
jgi:hypothetical protein